MKTKSEHIFSNHPQSGNVLIYVLIAIVLFAALSFTFTRRNNSQSTSQVTAAKTESHATELIGYTAQAKSVIDQMTLSGSQITALDFTLPSDPAFNSDPIIHKVYHPSGGGLSPYILPKDVAAPDLSPPSGVYLGLFNNTEWTPTAAPDIMLSAYGITKDICASLNKKITGSADIPAVIGDAPRYFIDASFHNANTDFEESDCTDCKDRLTLCVSDTGGKIFTFYSILTPR